MALPTQLATSFQVFVEGFPLLGPARSSLVAVNVEQNRNLPNMAVLEFNDQSGYTCIEGGLVIGASITVRACDLLDPIGIGLFHGEIVALETEYDHTGNRLLVRCYDKMHRLMRQRNTRAFPLMSYSEIAIELAVLNGILPGLIEPHPVVHEHVTQWNIDDWSFLQSLAEEIGFVCRLEEGLLSFHLPTPAELAVPAVSPLLPDPLTLYNGDQSILRLRSSITASNQVSEVSAQGWSNEMLPMLGESPAETESAATIARPELIALEFGFAQEIVTDRALDSEAHAEALAIGRAMGTAGSYAEVEGELVGNPFFQADLPISIGGFGALLDGEYTLSSCRHTWDGVHGYRTQFSVSDRQDRSLLGVASNHVRPRKNLVTGVVPAVVVDNEDLEGLMRVALSFPWLSLTYVSNFARVACPGAGFETGLFMLPEIGDEVLVAFEHGDPNRPYVLGGLYNRIQEPPGNLVTTVEAGVVLERVWRSRGGHKITLSDNPANFCIDISAADGIHSMKIGGDESGFSVMTPLPVSVTTTAEVSVMASVISLEAAAEISITAGGAVEIQAGAELSISAAGAIEISGMADLSMSGAGAAELSAGGDLSLVGGGATEVAAGGDLTLGVGGAMELEAGGAITLDAAGAINLAAAGDVGIESAAFTVEAGLVNLM